MQAYLDNSQGIVYIYLVKTQKEDKKMDNFLKQLQREIDRLTLEKQDIDRKIRALESALDTYLKETGGKSSSKEEESRGDKIEKIIRLAGKPLHYKEVVRKLQEEGYVFEASNPNAATTATLSMDNRFKRVKRGTYTLSSKKENNIGLFE